MKEVADFVLLVCHSELLCQWSSCIYLSMDITASVVLILASNYSRSSGYGPTDWIKDILTV